MKEKELIDELSTFPEWDLIGKKVISEVYRMEEEQEFDELMELQHSDDRMLQNKFQTLNHKGFNYLLLNVGQMLNIITTFFSFMSKYLEPKLNLEKDKVKEREVKKMIKDLNEKINLRFDLDEETRVIPCLIYYNNEPYLLINKCLFADLMLDKVDF